MTIASSGGGGLCIAAVALGTSDSLSVSQIALGYHGFCTFHIQMCYRSGLVSLPTTEGIECDEFCPISAKERAWPTIALSHTRGRSCVLAGLFSNALDG